MNTRQTLQWIITAAIRLLAGALAVKFGSNAIGTESTWTALADGLTAAAAAGVSIYTSIRSRQALRDAEPPTA